jgi:signal transduction histidine kinase/CheY-like chemotaxis protein
MSSIPAPLPLSKLIEDATAASFREISHLVPLWFWETDPDYLVTYCSDNLEPLTGITPQEVVGVCILNPVYGRGEAEAGLKDYHDALRRREVIENFCYERILVSGERVVLLDSAMPQFDSQGEFTGYSGISFHLSKALDVAGGNGSLVGTLKDRADALELALSERNKELASSNRLLAEVLDALGEGLLVTSGEQLQGPDNVVEFVNPALRDLIGLHEKEVYQGMRTGELRDLLDARVTSEVPSDKLATLLWHGHKILMHVTKTGKLLEVKGLPRPNGGMVVVMSDITQLQARTRLLEKARQDAEQATEAKSNFLASMSHEIRTPMNGIIGVSELLSETPLNGEQSQFVETIRRSAMALTELIGDILDFSKIEAGHLRLTQETLNLAELFQDVSNMMTPMAQAKNISFRVDIREDAPHCVLGDKLRLHQILINLLGNAIKFTQQGGVTLTVWPEGVNRVRVDVTDTGVGIPPQHLDTVFNSFEQVQGGFQRPFEGSGLGLAITRELVDAMGGRIWVKSQLGQGATFSLDLPLITTENVMAIPEAIAAPALDLSDRRILLAEDNLTNQFVVKKMLQRLGAKPKIVGNGQEACDAMAQDVFDLVLMDISMPVMSGLDATRRIRRMERERGRPPCHIIALTGNAFETDRQSSVDAGMDGFLTKPIQKDQLQRCLCDVLSISECGAP